MGIYIEVERDVKLYVEDIGEGTPVVFIHGWPLNHKMFEYQLNVLPKYGVRCIVPDLRGYGRSDRPWDGYSYDRMADDIYTLIETMGLREVVLAGFSMGGAICIRYMGRHQGYRVSKLALFGAAAPSFTKRANFPIGHTKEYVNGLIAQAYSDRPALVADIGKHFFYSEHSVSPSFSNWFWSLGMEASGHSTIQSAESLRDEEVFSDMAQIRVPTAIFHGKADQICPFPLAEAMHAGIPGSELTAFDRSGHGLFFEEKEKFNKELLRFIQSTGTIRSRIGNEVRIY